MNLCLMHCTDAHGQSLASLITHHQLSSSFNKLFNEVEVNDLSVSGMEMDLRMDVERSARFLTSMIKDSGLVHYVHNELPVRVMHWIDRNRSFMLVFAQVGNDRTKGLLSTLDFHHNHKVDITLRENSNSDRPEHSEKKKILKSLKHQSRQTLFTYVDQHVLSGYADLSTIQTTSSTYRELLNSQSWVPIIETHGSIVMGKHGETIELTHHDDESQTLSLLYSK